MHMGIDSANTLNTNAQTAAHHSRSPPKGGGTPLARVNGAGPHPGASGEVRAKLGLLLNGTLTPEHYYRQYT